MKYATNSGTYITGVGQRILSIHSHRECRGRNCVIHHPSNHKLSHLPTVWTNRGMTRLCPHGQLHEDPDDAAFRRLSEIEAGAERGIAHGWLNTNHAGQYIIESYWTPSLGNGIVCDGCCDKDHPLGTVVPYVRMEMM